MKKTLLLILTVSAFQFSAFAVDTNAVAICEAAIGAENMIETDYLFAEYLTPTKIRSKKTALIAYRSLRTEAEKLEERVSLEFQTARWGVIVSDTLTLADILLTEPVDLGDGTVIIDLSMKDLGGGRNAYTSSWHFAMWMQAVGPYGYTAADTMSTAEKRVLLKQMRPDLFPEEQQ